MNIQTLLQDKIKQALNAIGLPSEIDPQIRPALQETFGDYQVNGLMAVAKRLQHPARQLAQEVAAALPLTGPLHRVEVAGPGFLNLFLARDWLAEQADRALADQQLTVTCATPVQTIVVDYSGPNVAKAMAVHHLRSTVIGDAMVRTLCFLGHRVIKANHIGDWGTQFGMLIAYLREMQQKAETHCALTDLEHFYRAAKQRYDSDPTFAERARDAVVKLQNGDPACLAYWRQLVQTTMRQNQALYQRLNVLLTPQDTMGESFYNPMLPHIVSDLKARGLAVESEGAIVVYLPQCTNKQGQPMGVIVQKRDGGFLYTTTDIACAKYRYETFSADRILYFVDSRQQQHLLHAWAIVRKAGYVPSYVSLEYHPFGMMLGKDGKPFKTRAGRNVKLTELLDEALQRTEQLLKDKNSSLEGQARQQACQAIAIGAIKYADLHRNRTTNYTFDWESMLSLEGNTAPYLQYAYSRICAIFKRSGLSFHSLPGSIQLLDPIEHQLTVKLLQFEEILYQVAREGTPHLTCHYLYGVAGLFSCFYESCPILHHPEIAIRHSRLRLAALTAKTLQQGLDTLGIQTVERM